MALQRLNSWFCLGSDLRLKEVQFIKTELELKLDEVIVETDELITLQTRVAKALEATGEPLRVTNLCLEERSDWEMMVGNNNAVMLILAFPGPQDETRSRDAAG